MRIFLLMIYTLWLAACVSHFTPPVLNLAPEQAPLWFQVDKLDANGNTEQSTLLSIQVQDQQHTRWLLADTFGVPQARFILSPQGWQRDGFIPPNREVQQFFNALLPLLPQGIQQTTTIVTPQRHWRIRPLSPSE